MREARIVGTRWYMTPTSTLRTSTRFGWHRILTVRSLTTQL